MQIIINIDDNDDVLKHNIFIAMIDAINISRNHSVEQSLIKPSIQVLKHNVNVTVDDDNSTINIKSNT